jgi:hypothetical protein
VRPLRHLVLLASLSLPLVGCLLDSGSAELQDEPSDQASAGTRFQALVPELSATDAPAIALEDAHVAVYRAGITRAQDVMPALELAARAQKPLLIVSASAFPQSLLGELADLHHAGLVRVHAVQVANADTFARLVHLSAATPLEPGARDAITLEDLGYVRSTTLAADSLRVVPGR